LSFSQRKKSQAQRPEICPEEPKTQQTPSSIIRQKQQLEQLEKRGWNCGENCDFGRRREKGKRGDESNLLKKPGGRYGKTSIERSEARAQNKRGTGSSNDFGAKEKERGERRPSKGFERLNLELVAEVLNASYEKREIGEKTRVPGDPEGRGAT